MPALHIQLLTHRPHRSARARPREIFLDVAHPGALHHDHDRDALWFEADAATGRFELDWEGLLAPAEILRAISITPADFRLRPTAPAPGMVIDLHPIHVQQIAQPRSGTRFAPERFPKRTPPPKVHDGKRDAVVFAWWVPANPEAHMVGEYYLGLLRYHHADSKLFVGVNHGSDPTWIAALQDSGLDLELALVPPEIRMDSDAAGFLAALRAFARHPEAFDLVWFGHTKGASRPNYNYDGRFRYEHDRRLWSRRAEVDRFFADPEIGLYAHRYGLPHAAGDSVPGTGFGELDALRRIYRDDYAPLGLWAWETVYVLREQIVRRFCDVVGEEFFLRDPATYGAGRWFFEAAFPSIASMQGYEPLIELDTDGEGDPRDDIALFDDPRQGNRLAMEELLRWRKDPFTFTPRALPRGFSPTEERQ
jgi:hypothetical protein